MQVTYNWSGRTLQNEDDTQECFTILTKEVGEIIPSVDVWRFPRDIFPPKPKASVIDSLVSMLKLTFQNCQRILYRRRPEDGPYIFHPLCLLHFIMF